MIQLQDVTRPTKPNNRFCLERSTAQKQVGCALCALCNVAAFQQLVVVCVAFTNIVAVQLDACRATGGLVANLVANLVAKLGAK